MSVPRLQVSATAVSLISSTLIPPGGPGGPEKKNWYFNIQIKYSENESSLTFLLVFIGYKAFKSHFLLKNRLKMDIYILILYRVIQRISALASNNYQMKLP